MLYEVITDHLESLQIVDDALKLVRELPYGRQRLVEIAIALAQRPRRITSYNVCYTKLLRLPRGPY